MDQLKGNILGWRKSIVQKIRHTSLANDNAFREYKDQVINEKRYRVNTIKTDEMKRELRLKNLREKRIYIYDNTVDYSKRRSQELDGVCSVKHNLSSLETLESELMSKLQNTKANVSKANQEYMSALDNAYTSQEIRIANLKQKLQKHRSRYMNVQVSLNLNKNLFPH